ncbi:glycosyltransferase family 2 protein [Parvularcula marina]|uniref:Glycosyltransferase family 2 protein n=1 Tax=Parvularcula marina TaxID=2292771 RepID=A0A371RGF6_9PROT|nr:glycosyltransferase family 2 protein [Parvularcula marina]RFB04505.1 glycosyltransferase family 2 protein [Parvularcula marina]
MTGDIPISVIIPAKNEEANLPRCLSRLKRFAEVVIVDSGSEDRTGEIAREFGAEIIQFDWNGRYPKKRNWYLLNHKPKCDWVLFLDADEIIDDVFCEEAARAVASGTHDGYWLNYTNFFLGKPLKYGDPQRKLALFRFGAGLYERIDEMGWSRLDMEVHEHPVIDGPIGEITTRIEHNDYRGIAKFIDRHRDYALWEAKRVEVLRARGLENAEHLTDRQRTKYKNIDKWWFPWSYFAFTYFAKRGFLDGGPGFAIAFYKLWYFFSIRLLIRENMRDQQNEAQASSGAITETAAGPQAN